MSDNSKYPRLGQDRRNPDRERDGANNVGKPCIVCGKFTLGIKWMQTDYMRGNDEEVRVCGDHWKRHSHDIVNAYIAAGERQ